MFRKLDFKRLSAIFLFVIYVMNINILYASADLFEGHAEKYDKESILDKKLFTGHVDELDSKDIIHMSVSQVLDASFSIEGDEFFAEVTNDVCGDKGIIIPRGTLAHGIIRGSTESKRLGRDGYIDLKFDYLVTPDGREIPIEGNMSTRMHPIKAAAKIVATDVGYTAAGGLVGGFVALNLLGLEAAIASNGYTVAGGAAVGGALGLGMALYRKGKDVLIAPGDEIRVKINSSVSLPVYRYEALIQKELQYPGLTVKITNVIYEKDPFGQLNTVTLSLVISNMTKRTFSSFDLALVNESNSVFHPSIFGDTRLMYTNIKPGDRLAGRVSFSVNNVKDRYWLTFFDKGGRKALAKISIDNAYKNVPEKIKNKNNKIHSKKNYYKEEDIFNMT